MSGEAVRFFLYYNVLPAVFNPARADVFDNLAGLWLIGISQSLLPVTTKNLGEQGEMGCPPPVAHTTPREIRSNWTSSSARRWPADRSAQQRTTQNVRIQIHFKVCEQLWNNLSVGKTWLCKGDGQNSHQRLWSHGVFLWARGVSEEISAHMRANCCFSSYYLYPKANSSISVKSKRHITTQCLCLLHKYNMRVYTIYKAFMMYMLLQFVYSRGQTWSLFIFCCRIFEGALSGLKTSST